MVREPKSLARLFARGGVNGMIFLFPTGHVVNYVALLAINKSDFKATRKILNCATKSFEM